LQTVVKKWFRDKESGFLDNGGGQDIMVRKEDLVNCQFLKVGVMVEFECHTDKRGLVAKNVKLTRQNQNNQGGQGGYNRNRGGNQNQKPYRPGVMT